MQYSTTSRPLRSSRGIGIAVGLVLLAGLTANPALTMVSALAPWIFVALLWRQGEPPILLSVVMFQWLQVTARVFHADIRNVPVSSIPGWAAPDQLDRAIWLSLSALLVLAVGIRLGLGKSHRNAPRAADEDLLAWRSGRVFAAYAILAVLSEVLVALRWSIPVFAQILVALAAAKWIAFYIGAYLVLSRRGPPLYLAAAVGFEIVLGLGGYFSGFRIVFFVLLLALLSVELRMSARALRWSVVTGALLLLLSVGWIGVRDQYRAYLNQGTESQVILVSWPDRMYRIAFLMTELSAADALHSLERGMTRLAYVDFFSAALDRVPAEVPHAEGALWEKSITHVLMPRLLFPDKPALPSDSELTMRFTGYSLAGGARGTSISLGYVAESYVDFGPLGMFLPIFLLGVAWGWMHTFFVRRTPSALLGYGFSVALFLNATNFEIAGVKLLGGMLSRFIVLALLTLFGTSVVLTWLRGGPERPAGLFDPARLTLK